MSEKPEALRLAENLENPWHALRVSSRLLPGVDPLIVGGLRLDAAIELRRQHAEIERLKAENERLREALAWAYNLRHLRGHSDPVVIPQRFAPFIEAALRREDKA